MGRMQKTCWAAGPKRLRREKKMIEEPKLSIEQLQQQISQNPADSKAYSLLGNALSSQGLWAEAIYAWQQAIRLDPEDDHAQFCISLLISGDEPVVKPTAELLRFLTEHTDGHYLRLGQAVEAIPLLAGSEPPIA